MKINRRRFLCSASIFSVLAGCPTIAEAWFPHGIPSTGFYSNPNVTITAINTSPSTVVVTGTTNVTAAPSNNPRIINNVSSLVGIAIGQQITGTNVLANTTIAFVGVNELGNNIIIMSQNATAAGSTTLTCGGNAIACSRLAGLTPAFFQVSGAFISASGTSNPYADLQYQWNFGDPTGTETFIRPTDGALVSANSAQICPQATYVYRNAGTYTITCTIRGKNGSGFTTATATQQVVVSAFSSVSPTAMWFDSINGNDANNGTSPTTPQQTQTAIQTFIDSSSSGPNKWIHLANGSNWSQSSALTLDAISGVRFDTYVPPQTSATAMPTLTVSTGNVGNILLRGGNAGVQSPKSDYVFSGIGVYQVGQASGGSPFTIINLAPNNFFGIVSDIHFDNCLFSSNTSGPGAGQCTNGPGNCLFNFVHWKCTFQADLSVFSVLGAANNGSGLIRLQTTSTSNLVTGQRITVTGVVGTTEANNSNTGAVTWTITVIDLTHIDLQGSTFANAYVSGGTFSQTPNGMFGSARNWHSNVGCTFTGNGINISQDHYLYPEVQNFYHVLWNNFSPNALRIGKNEISTMRWNSVSGSVEQASYLALTENGCNGVSQITDFNESPTTAATFTSGVADIALTSINIAPTVGGTISFGPRSAQAFPSNINPLQVYFVVAYNSGASTIQVSATSVGSAITPNASSAGSVTVILVKTSYAVIERNVVSNFIVNTAGIVVATGRAINLTVRYNRVWNYGNANFIQAEQRLASVLQVQSYFNQMARNSSAVGGALHSFSTGTFAKAQTITDNVVYDQRATPLMNATIYADQTAAGSLWDRNSYSNTAGATNLMQNNGANSTFAQWQSAGFDPNGTNLGASPPPAWTTVPPTSWAGFGP